MWPSPLSALGAAGVIWKTGYWSGDPLELLQRGVPVHRQVRPGSRCDLQVAPQDGRPVTRFDLGQAHLLAAAAPQPCTATGRADVGHPVRSANLPAILT